MSQNQSKIIVFWFRRDLRLQDNTGLYRALSSGRPVLPLFIFDHDILEELEDKRDRRVEFIHFTLKEIQDELRKTGSSLLIRHGKPLAVWKDLAQAFDIAAVYANHDYEPYAGKRDQEIEEFLTSRGIEFHTFKDQVIFEKNEILTAEGKPYTVYTPYRNSWRKALGGDNIKPNPSEDLIGNFQKTDPFPFPALPEIGFETTGTKFPAWALREDIIRNYHKQRDYPAIDGTSRLSVHLRFGTVSIRQLVRRALNLNETWLDELVWREFFMMILWHFPYVVDQPFREKYAAIPWCNDEKEFKAWCEGKTGYPMVDAGMRELNNTGYMHNRVRMITASFLTKHLLIVWRWGER
jgi:deoxyribodipyrimidine photo-lyase